jgi:predicted phosphodiesterase
VAGCASCRSAGASTSGSAVLVLHDRALLGLDFTKEGLRVVVFGHSYWFLAERYGGVFWFNLGSVGWRWFRLSVSVGRFVIEAGCVRLRLIALDA